MPFCLSLILVLVVVLVGVGGNKAFAATVYEGPCSSDAGNFTLSPAYSNGGKTYNCVRDTVAGDWFAAPPDGVCPFGAPGYVVPGFGKACLWYDKITIGVSAAPQATSTHIIATDCNDATLNASNCGIVRYLIIFINVLSGLVGIVVITMIIIGGIQYSAAGDDPQKIQEAKKKISNALLALVVFIFMYVFLQWIVPGGIF